MKSSATKKFAVNALLRTLLGTGIAFAALSQANAQNALPAPSASLPAPVATTAAPQANTASPAPQAAMQANNQPAVNQATPAPAPQNKMATADVKPQFTVEQGSVMAESSANSANMLELSREKDRLGLMKQIEELKNEIKKLQTAGVESSDPASPQNAVQQSLIKELKTLMNKKEVPSSERSNFFKSNFIVTSIYGVQGNLSAEMSIGKGTSYNVQRGTILPSGEIVSDISSSAVTLKDSKGKLRRVGVSSEAEVGLYKEYQAGLLLKDKDRTNQLSGLIQMTSGPQVQQPLGLPPLGGGAVSYPGR